MTRAAAVAGRCLNGRRLKVAAGALLVLPMIAPVAAAHAASGPAMPANLQPSLTYPVTGEMPVICTIGQSFHDAELTDVVNPATNTARAATTELPFSVRCNTPMLVTLGSMNGGLRTEARTDDSDFTSLLTYTARLDMPGHAGALSCTSATMTTDATPCNRLFTEAVTEGDGKVQVTINPDGKLLLQGRYADRLTVTLSPQLGGG